MQPEFDAPAKLGSYEIIRELGRGAMGRVYFARHIWLQTEAVVKVISFHEQDAEIRTRFIQEARSAASCDHENIVKIIDFGESKGRLFLVMEHLDGETLREIMERRAALPLLHQVSIARQITEALQHLHSRPDPIVHRDIKPANVFVCRNGVVKLIDFGISKQLGVDLTQPGASLGTPSYMAPEQVLAKTVGPHTDLYSLGIVIYELFSGTRAVEAGSFTEICCKVLNSPLDEHRLPAGVPAEVRHIIRRCTKKDAREREHSAEHVARDLQILEARLRSEQPIVARARPTRAKCLAVATACVALALMQAGSTSNSPPLIETPEGRMCLVRTGPFLFGLDKKRKWLDDYYIDETEVTNRSYVRFCRATARITRQDMLEHPEFPVTGITFSDAAAFATWAGKRLPTPEEWEKAARGSDGRRFPWGDEPAPWKANVRRKSSPGDMLPAQCCGEDRSPVGALNMAGNAWEFVNGHRAPTYDEWSSFQSRCPSLSTAASKWDLIYGGAFDRPLAAAGVADAALVPRGFSAASIGFRCIRGRERR